MNEALGIELGYRRTKSPVVCPEPGAAPAERGRYTPTTWPGGRLPSVNPDDGRAMSDVLSPGFTLLRFTDIDVQPLVDEPDQHVVWRGNALSDASVGIVDRVPGEHRGHLTDVAPGPMVLMLGADVTHARLSESKVVMHVISAVMGPRSPAAGTGHMPSERTRLGHCFPGDGS
ncbi:hypothetical protein [Streptomyces canus]|uniref:hypothetical protein n=1 Tax=Streptomyces canus TaxID=58343 RepID=UPI003720165C